MKLLNRREVFSPNASPKPPPWISEEERSVLLKWLIDGSLSFVAKAKEHRSRSDVDA